MPAFHIARSILMALPPFFSSPFGSQALPTLSRAPCLQQAVDGRKVFAWAGKSDRLPSPRLNPPTSVGDNSAAAGNLTHEL
jgi:hypothetical protein